MKMPKRINAGIKSPAEAAQRMQDGEVFYAKSGSRLTYDELAEAKFVYSLYGEVGTPIAGLWSSVDEWLVAVEMPWYEEEDAFPRLCWVSDRNPEEARHSAIIIRYIAGHAFPFNAADGGIKWKLAKPFNSEEAAKYIR